jgi:hypothetical protein
MCINKLALKDTIYHIPKGVHISNEDLTYYADHILNELEQVGVTSEEETDAYLYVEKVATKLKEWARQGHGVKVI